MPNDPIFNFLYVGIIALHLFWVISNPTAYKAQLKKHRKPQYIVLYIIQGAIYIVGFYNHFFFPFAKTSFDQQVISFGITIFLIGLFFSFWAKWTMKKNWGMPAQQEYTRQTELITNGPFAFSRNPIYVGLLLVSFGYSIALLSFYAFLICFLEIFYFYKAIQTEEKLLEEQFGRKYLDYKGKTPRFLFF